uniref:Uncharacterized protein n=1 Tax=Fusarium oxysporum (strain Fo5176) TaxID=660025 RepID=A0A0D2YG95_FUSOF
MGMPYSKQVHAAFDQVTPLVAAGFEVLRTTKNIAVFLAFLQVFVAIILTLTLLAILAVLVVLGTAGLGIFLWQGSTTDVIPEVEGEDDTPEDIE